MFVSSVSSGLRVQRPNTPCRAAVGRTVSQPHRMTVETSRVFRGSQSRSMAAEQLRTRAATESEAATSSTDDKTWYALVANAEFMLNEVQNEAFAEQLREKARFYTEKEMKRDFFLVCDPDWLDEQHGEKAKAVGRPCVALIAKDKVWITFMKLRLDRVLMLEVAGTEEEITKCGGPVPKFGAPARWTAPYSRYAEGWWEPFMPGRVE